MAKKKPTKTKVKPAQVTPPPRRGTWYPAPQRIACVGPGCPGWREPGC